MNWFHAQGGNQSGPVSEEAFVELVRAGTIQSSTLVWREGWPAWKAFSMLSNAELPTALIGLSSVPPPIPTATTSCTQCRKAFAPGDLVALKGHTVCAQCKPILIQSLSEGAIVHGGHEIFTDGKDLILMPDAELPHRCVHCNAPGTWRRQRTFYWNPPWIYIFVISPLILVIVSLLTRKKLKASVSLCEQHAGKRTKAVIAGWGFLALSIFLGILGIVDPGPNANPFFLAAFVGFVVACAVAFIWVPILTPRRITKTAGRFSKASPEFIKDLPEWKGEKL